MAPIKRKSSSSLASSSKKRKFSSSSSTGTSDPKPFTPGHISSSRRHKPSSVTSTGPAKSSSSSLSTSASTSSSSAKKFSKPKITKKALAIKAKSKVKKPLKERYTDSQLHLPTLNGIVPIGVTQPRGRKKGKVFVEDRDTMMGILEVVNEGIDGVIKGKVEKNRKLEILRENKRREQEAKEKVKESKLEDVKDSLRRKRKRKGGDVEGTDEAEEPRREEDGKRRKRVSFA